MWQQPGTTEKVPTWHQLSRRFAGERDCLAAFLAMETAEVLAGVKPANLINLADRPQSCGRNLHRLWQRHGRALLATSGLAWRELPGRRGSLLLLIYQAEALAALLARPATQAVLTRAGYTDPANPVAALEQLTQRLSGDGFPHEIGVFLGYPLKDVAAFLGWVELPFSCQALWRIYGRPERSLELAQAFRESRCRMAQRLAADDPLQCLQVAPRGGFFCADIENDVHFQKRRKPCASQSSAA